MTATNYSPDFEKQLDDFIDRCIAEDVGDGDHTSLSTIPAEALGRAHLLIKEAGVLAGVEVARKVFEHLDQAFKVEVKLQDGTRVKPGDIAFVVEGATRTLLLAERLVLNIMQHMSGIATTTARYADELRGLKTTVIDTRKTTPGMRLLDKMAVRIGGGSNHRIGLFDMILIKDNHIDFAGSIETAIDRANEYLRRECRTMPIEVEVRGFEELAKVLQHGGVQRIMLDNFSVSDTAKAVALINHRCEVESSGGITLQTLRQYAEAGVDFISVGALTHHVAALDMSLKAC